MLVLMGVIPGYDYIVVIPKENVKMGETNVNQTTSTRKHLKKQVVGNS